jgi:ribose 5-phosphate isomerase B
MSEKIGIACDHGGIELKVMVHDYLKHLDVEVVDYGVSADAKKSVDYPDYAELLCSDISKGEIDRGILICGTGIGMSIAANKFSGVRAALVADPFSCEMSRRHNDANVLCLGARVINHHRAVDLCKLWLTTPFDGDRHEARLKKIHEIEKKNFIAH